MFFFFSVSNVKCQMMIFKSKCIYVGDTVIILPSIMIDCRIKGFFPSLDTQEIYSSLNFSILFFQQKKGFRKSSGFFFSTTTEKKIKEVNEWFMIFSWIELNLGKKISFGFGYFDQTMIALFWTSEKWMRKTGISYLIKITMIIWYCLGCLNFLKIDF